MEDDIRSGTMRRGLYFVIGIVLSVLGLIGIGVCAFTPRDTPFEGNAPADAAWQSAFIIGAGVAFGVGVLFLLMGFVASLRARRNR